MIDAARWNVKRSLWMLGIGLGLTSGAVRGQTCFWYTDNVEAKTPIRCVEKSDLSTPCSWPSDCTTVPASTPQTVREMHLAWHGCFGAVGGSSPPAGRGARWYAFHRQFEYDFNLWRDDNGYALIEQQDWCPGMNLAVAHDGAGLGPGDHPAGCGTGPGRPANVPCDVCIAFPQCLFVSGAGPLDCPAAPSASCSAGGVSFPHASLDQFPNVDDVSKLLDASFHGSMHGAIWVADLAPQCSGLTSDPDCIYNGDTLTSNCSPRDPMFWRLHKALDDVVRAWQDHQAVDLMVVIDRSGSMSDPDPSGVTKLEAAVQATEYFAELMDHSLETGENRIGLVSYSGGGAVKLPLTPVVSGLTAPGSAFSDALDDILVDGPSGCTSMGAGIEAALGELCPNGGDCRLNPQPAPAGTNARKAILLLTDGLENVAPCLQSGGASGPTCGNQCFGAQVDHDAIEFTQFAAVGFGSAAGLNGDLLTLLAERQGGIYTQNPGAAGDDLKYFYTMAFGQLTDEFVFVDPRGTLPAIDLATPLVDYDSCADESKITYTSGWQTPVGKDDLRLLVTRPDGSLVRSGPSVQSGAADLWAYHRIGAPGPAGLGTWQGQLVRPHWQFYNGFSPDAFEKEDEGVRIVRRQIQRLCPDGCERVLLYEQGVEAARSAYRAALKLELDSGLVGSVEEAADPGDLASRLQKDDWDLIVYAAISGGPAPYDAPLGEALCRFQRAIVTDLRPSAGGAVLECAGAPASAGFKIIEGDGRLFHGHVKVGGSAAAAANRGFLPTPWAQATAGGGKIAAIVARGKSGAEHDWFVNVLGQGLGRISPVPMRFERRTGDPLQVAARILPSYHRAGGWDHVDARVEVTYPLKSLGTLLAGLDLPVPTESEEANNAAALAGVVIPTGTAVFPLFDDGTHGDINPRNGHWTATLTGLGAVDGMYKLRYIFDLTAGACTTRREVTQDIFVDLRVERKASEPRVTAVAPGLVRVALRPRDAFGNLWGPGRPSVASCAPAAACGVKEVTDLGKGSFEVLLAVDEGVAGVRLSAFDTSFDLPLDCDQCPRLEGMKLPGPGVDEHARLVGEVVLSGAAGGKSKDTIVFLDSSNPRLAKVPSEVLVPAGELTAAFDVHILHSHDGPGRVEITARLGRDAAMSSLLVRPLDKGDVGPFVLPEGGEMMAPDHEMGAQQEASGE